ncbi:TRAP transporter small permease [Sneathiella chinensis]|uniref:TRAP transporter small permease protein n=1 Tax=Sneathiella chinensis TaxID=349750 RepID=A0ABQ5U5A3_9PROT|nr:TRAP transporter small permease subunit [Sneathiella chinensis]GLQ06860.1 hypothetical protein GCM10007924_20810 [Sneathiella chinensis]
MELCVLVKNGVVAFSHGLARLELWVCKFLIVFFAGLLLVNVLLRYVLSSPLYFAEELAVYTLIWMAFLASSVAMANRQMISLTFIADYLSGPARTALNILVEALMCAVSLVLMYVSFRWVNSGAVAFEQALTLGTLKWPFYSIMPLFFTLTSFHTFANVLYLLGGDAGRNEETS